MNHLDLNIAGYLFRFKAIDKRFEPILSWLKDDFISCASSNHPAKLIAEIEIGAFQKPFAIPFFWRPNVVVYKGLSSTYYSYACGKTQFKITFGKVRHLCASSEDIHELYNAIYLYIISHLVESLEDTGWVPLHALSLQFENKTFAIIAPSGFGKSLLALKLLNDPDIKIFGDELAFTDGSKILSIPLRLALAPGAYLAHNLPPTQKRVLYLNGTPHKWTMLNPNPLSDTTTVHKIFVIQAKNEKWQVPHKPHLSAWAWWSLLSASGVPQMIQYLMRIQFIFNLPSRLWHRLHTLQLLLKAQKLKAIEAHPDSISDLKLFLKQQ